MTVSSRGYPRFAGGVLVSLMILVEPAGQALAEDWQGAATTAWLEGWSGGFPVETAQADARFDFDIPAEALAVALTRFQQITGLKVAADSKTIAAARTVGVSGTMTAQEALVALLAGTGLSHRMADAETVAIEQVTANTQSDGPVVLSPLPVTAEGDSQLPTGPVEGYVAERGTSGTKTDTPLIETPQSISVITRDQMDAQGANDVGDVLRYTAGANSEVYGTDKRAVFFQFRGFNVADEAFYRDGLRLQGSEYAGFASLDPYGAERYELIRGPSSVLYGQITPAGLLNYVTKRPTEEVFREVQIEGGMVNRGGGAFDVGGPVTADGDLLFRLTGRGFHADTQVDFVDENRGYFAPALTFRPSDDTTLTVLANVQYDRFGWSNQFLPASGTVFDNPNGRIPRSRFLGEPEWDDYEQHQESIGYLFEHRFDETFTFRQNARYAHMENHQKGVFAAGLQADGRTLDRYGDAGVSFLDAVAVDTQLEVKVPTDVGVDQTLLVGVDFMRNVQSDVGKGYDVAPIDVYDPDYGAELTYTGDYYDADTVLRQIGLYAQDQIRVGDLTLVLGGRYDWAQVDTLERVNDVDEVQDDTAFTGRAGAIYQFDFGLAPYASYSTSFTPKVGTDANGTPFEPETGEQVEVGVKYQPNLSKDAGVDAFVTLSAFKIWQQNILTTDPADNNFSIQTGEVQSRGIEFEGVANFDVGLSLIAAYALTDAEITKTEDGVQGNTPYGIPRHKASLWADYTIQEGPFADFGFGFGVRYTGETWGNDANSFKVPDFAVFDAAVHYQWNDVRFQVNATNLFDKRYISPCFGDAAGCYYGERLQVIGSVKVQW
jgi:iron complex outermembrane recepter protein